ncbi:MAG: hypothetical protein JWP97_4286 [Labilithrix sp.]|nr:hypothetical protein [Labilithrix sp.]
MPSSKVLGLCAAALASFVAIGCSGEPEGPGPLENPADPAGLTAEERAELAALDVEADEAVVDEGDLAAIDEGRAEPDDALPPEADEEPADEVDTSDLATLGLSRIPLAGESQGRVRTCVKSDPAATPRCLCAGSMLNCRVPSAQIGKNRWLPPTWDSYLKAHPAIDRSNVVIGVGRWEVKPRTVMVDGLGGVRGTFTSPCQRLTTTVVNGTTTYGAEPDPAMAGKTCVKINYGQIKAIPRGSNNRYVYAFNVQLTNGFDAAGWIKLDDVVRKSELVKMGTHSPPHVTKLVATSYVVRSAKDYGLDPATFRQDQLSGAATWSFLKNKAPQDGSREANDYLLNNGNIVNLAYATPGVGGPATDTLPVGDHTLGFERARSTKSRPAIVWVPVYDTAQKAHKMFFVYGRIDDRYGWMAAAAIMKGKVKPGATGPSTGDPCEGKSDGAYCTEILKSTGYACQGGKTVAQPPAPCPGDRPFCVGQGAVTSTLACDG